MIQFDLVSKAIENITFSIKESPLNENGYILRGYFHETLGNLDKAIQDLNKSVALAPNNKDSYSVRANVFIKNNQFTLALKDLNIIFDNICATQTDSLIALLPLIKSRSQKAIANIEWKYNTTVLRNKYNTPDIVLS